MERGQNADGDLEIVFVEKAMMEEELSMVTNGSHISDHSVIDYDLDLLKYFSLRLRNWDNELISSSIFFFFNFKFTP